LEIEEMTTYTLIDTQDNVTDRGLSLVDAAREILTYDGHDYEVRLENDGWYYLFGSTGSRNSQSGLGKFNQSYCNGRILMEQASSEAEAFEKFAAKIIHNDWVRTPTAMTDADYDKQEADFAAQNSDDE
jgi:hypothetical protein